MPLCLRKCEDYCRCRTCLFSLSKERGYYFFFSFFFFKKEACTGNFLKTTYKIRIREKCFFRSAQTQAFANAVTPKTSWATRVYGLVFSHEVNLLFGDVKDPTLYWWSLCPSGLPIETPSGSQ